MGTGETEMYVILYMMDKSVIELWASRAQYESIRKEYSRKIKRVKIMYEIRFLSPNLVP